MWWRVFATRRQWRICLKKCLRSTEQFHEIADRLERHYKDVQDLEFTIERGQLYMLQTRSAKRTGASAVKAAVDMVHEGSSPGGRGEAR